MSTSGTGCIRALLLVAVCGGLRSPAVACDRAHFRIILDVGHTESAPGATSARGVPELTFNRELVKVVQKRLAGDGFASVTVLNGRFAGHADLIDRVERANAVRPDVFLSLHHDSVQESFLTPWVAEDGSSRLECQRYSGYSLFVSRRNTRAAQSLDLARDIGRELIARGLHFTQHHAANIKGENRPWADQRLGVYDFDDLAVIKYTNAPAVLLENGLIVNPDEEKTLASPQRRDLVAGALSAAFTSFCDAH